jgi:hypothetical protein
MFITLASEVKGAKVYGACLFLLWKVVHQEQKIYLHKYLLNKFKIYKIYIFISYGC